jgi:cytidylate kinase
MIVHINSYAGVGKLTIGRILADLIGGRLLDNHSIYNIAFAVTEFRSPAFYDTVRAARDLAFRRVLDLPQSTPVVLTNWYSQGSHWAEENWDAVVALARERQSAHNVVILSCTPDENAKRIQSSGRDAKRKPRDPALVDANRNGRPLIERDADRLLRLDVSELSAEQAAAAIAEWVAQVP